MELSTANVKSNLNISSDSNSLLSISFKSQNQEITRILLDFLNEEYMQDRKDLSESLALQAKNLLEKK